MNELHVKNFTRNRRITEHKEFSSETVKLKFLHGPIFFLIKNSDPLFQKFKSEANSNKIGF